jgi:hypothetical protein
MIFILAQASITALGAVPFNRVSHLFSTASARSGVHLEIETNKPIFLLLSSFADPTTDLV